MMRRLAVRRADHHRPPPRHVLPRRCPSSSRRPRVAERGPVGHGDRQGGARGAVVAALAMIVQDEMLHVVEAHALAGSSPEPGVLAQRDLPALKVEEAGAPRTEKEPEEAEEDHRTGRDAQQPTIARAAGPVDPDGPGQFIPNAGRRATTPGQPRFNSKVGLRPWARGELSPTRHRGIRLAVAN